MVVVIIKKPEPKLRILVCQNHNASQLTKNKVNMRNTGGPEIKTVLDTPT